METSASFWNNSTPESISSTTAGASSVYNLPFISLFVHGSDVVITLCFLFFVVGVPANIINIIVYVKTGVRDNVTVSFLALSVSDLGYLITVSPHLMTRVLEHIVAYRMRVAVNWLADPNATMFPFYWYSFVFYETSILINVYIAVVRCACVAIPFKVKSTFTSRRAIFTFTIFFFSAFLLRIPMIMKKRFILEFDPTRNTTWVKFKEFEDGGLAEKINDIVNRNILNWISFVTVISCLVVMATKLQNSVKFRASVGGRSAKQQSKNKNSNNATLEIHNQQKPMNCERHTSSSKEDLQLNTKPSLQGENSQVTSAQKEKQPTALSSKETQVLRSVLLIAAIFIICQFPLMAYTLARQISSEFDLSRNDGRIRKYTFLFSFFSNVSTAFAYMNSSVNFIVYYTFNSRYRQTIKALCHRK